MCEHLLEKSSKDVEYFLKWKVANQKMIEVSRKDSIHGTYLQLDAFKTKLNMFDKALEKLY